MHSELFNKVGDIFCNPCRLNFSPTIATNLKICTRQCVTQCLFQLTVSLYPGDEKGFGELHLCPGSNTVTNFTNFSIFRFSCICNKICDFLFKSTTNFMIFHNCVQSWTSLVNYQDV